MPEEKNDQNQAPSENLDSSETSDESTENSPEAVSDEALEQETQEWQETLGRLGIEYDPTKVTYQDILYLAKRWQFLQVVESTGSKEPLAEPEFITAKTGWVIHHYGDAMATSPGHLLYGGADFRILTGDDEGGDAGGGVNLGVGTMIKQAFDTAAEMVRLAQEYGWGGMLIVDGHPDMQRAAWVEAVRIGVGLDGFVADMKDERVRRRIVSVTLDEMRAAIDALSGAR